MTESRFGETVSRLCYLRRHADESELEIPLDPDGFLSSVAEALVGSDELTPGALVAPARVVHCGALVLLGEPGVGKSTTFEAIVTATESEFVRVDGAELTHETFQEHLGQHLQELPTVAGQPAQTRKLTVVIDQFDESPIVRSIARPLRRALEGRDVSGLKLMVASRTADYPAAVTEVLTATGLKVFLADLAPLTRNQAEYLASTVPGVDGPALVEAAVEASAGALASIPLTLSMLVAIYETEGRLEPDPQRLFADGVMHLADEPDDPRRGELETSTEQRLAIAGRTAARLLLTGRRTLWRGPQLHAGTMDLRAETLVGGPEKLPNGSTFDVTTPMVDETLATALFTGRGATRLAFRHSSIAAYLAASHLLSRQVPRRQLESLFLAAGFHGNRTIPTLLRETAAWLVTLDPEHTAWLVDADPLSFAAHGRIVDSEKTRALIVEALLERADEIELSDVPWARTPRRLAHEGLADQLRNVLADAGATEPADWPSVAQIRLAVRLAREASVAGLSNELLQIAGSEGWSPHLRQQAALTAFETEETAATPRLIQVLDRLKDETHASKVDPDDELRGALLALLWPQHISVEDVLLHLRPRRNRNLIGLYLRFERTFPETLSEDDLSPVLEWATALARRSGGRTTASETEGPEAPEIVRKRDALRIDTELLDGLVEQSLADASAVDRTREVAALLLPRLMRHDRAPLPTAVDLVDKRGQEPGATRVLRRALAYQLIKLLALQNADSRGDIWLVSNGWSDSTRTLPRQTGVPEGLARGGRSRLLTADDFEWVYEQAAIAQDVGDNALADKFTELASILFNPYETSALELVHSDHSHPVWERVKHWLEPVELESERAQRLRERHRRATEAEDDEEPAAEAEQFAEEQRQRLLDAQDGDGEAFWRLMWGLQFPPDTLRGHIQFGDDIATFPGIAVFADPDAALSQMAEAAVTFLANENDHRGEWLGTDHYDKRAWAGYLGLAVLVRLGRLHQVPASAWQDWVGAIVWFSSVPVNAGEKDLKVELLRQAAEHASAELADAAARYLRGELARDNMASEIELVDPTWAPVLVDTWRQLIDEIVDALRERNADAESPEGGFPPNQVRLTADGDAPGRAISTWEEMLQALVQVDPEAEELATQLLPNGAPDAGGPLSARAALILLRHDSSRWWGPVYERARAHPNFGRDLALAAANMRYEGPVLRNLSEAELADVYRWLSDLFPPDEDPVHQGAHFVGPEEQARDWRDAVLQQLSERGAETEVAVAALAELADEYPDRLLIKSHVVRAKTLAGESGWLPPEPDELARLLDDTQRRLVRNNAELAEVLMEVLEAVANDVEAHGDLLWDRVPKRLAPASTAVWLPKPEAAVSAYLTNELRHRLADRQVVVNREVLVRPTDEYGAGDSTDILVETASALVPLASSPRRAAVVLEIKGAWNPGVEAEQKTQLAERYLPEGDTEEGIFVVAWFPLELWTDAADYRRNRASRFAPLDLIEQLHKQAESIAIGLRVTTRPFLFSVPRAHRTSYDGEVEDRAGLLPCHNCGEPVRFGEWGGQPHWRCTNNPRHRMPVRKRHLSLPGMKDMIPKEDLAKLQGDWGEG